MTDTMNFNFDPSAVSAIQEVLPKGEYEFEVLTKKAFIRQAGEDKHDSYGIRYGLRVSLAPSGKEDLVGKKVTFSTYYQNEGAQAMAKQFLMACLGYGKNRSEEERFNREQAGKDWNFDPNEGSTGEAYNEIEGGRVIGSVDVTKNNASGDPMQQFKSWRSISSGPLNNS